MTETPSTTTPNPPAAASNTEQTGQQSTPVENMVPQSRFNEVNQRAKEAQAELDRIKAEQVAATEAAAKAQGKWQELAEKHTAELSEVKPKLKATEEQRDRYQAALEAHVKTLRKDVPEHISGLLDRLDPVDQLEWITKNQDQIGMSAGTPRGNGPSPRPAGQGTHETRVQENQKKLQSTGAYNPF